MDSAHQAQWLIKLEILTHQVNIVLEKCEQIKHFEERLDVMQKDCFQLFNETEPGRRIYYLKWYASVILFLKSEIDHVQTGRIVDKQQEQDVCQKGWERDNYNIFLLSSNNSEYNKHSIMSVDGVQSAMLDLLCHLYSELDEKTEFCKEIIETILPLELLIDKAKQCLCATLEEVIKYMECCSFWDVLQSKFPLESLKCRRTYDSEDIFVPQVLDRVYFAQQSRFSRKIISSNILAGTIPDEIHGSGLTVNILLNVCRQEQLSFANSWSATQAEYAWEEIRLKNQNKRITTAYPHQPTMISSKRIRENETEQDDT